MTTITAVDLSQLPAPNVVEPLDFEAIFAALLADLQARDPAFDALLESDPAYALLQVAAYRELLLRQRINEAARANFLATALGTDLDNLVAFYNVQRLQTDPGNPQAIPPIAPRYETDAELRQRAQGALHGFSTAGPEQAYRFHARSADGRVADVAARSPRFAPVDLSDEVRALLPPNAIVLQVIDDAGLAQPQPGDVAIHILARDGDGTAPADLLDAVAANLNQEQVRPLTDRVRVASAEVRPFAIIARLVPYGGAGADLAVQTAHERITAYLQDHRQIGRSHYRSALIAALHAPGIERVELHYPEQDVILAPHQVGHCVELTISRQDPLAREEDDAN